MLSKGSASMYAYQRRGLLERVTLEGFLLAESFRELSPGSQHRSSSPGARTALC
jgi:hypothetical protein